MTDTAMRNFVSAQAIQYGLASVFLILGGWCLISPGSVLHLAITPEYQSADPIVLALMRAFGAQAMIAGLFAALSRFRKRTFLGYGLALLPFFVFDWYFYAREPMLTEIGLLDVVGNIVMLAFCWLGWKRAAH